MGKKLNLIGKRFGKLLVLNLSNTTSKIHRYWDCICDCGKTTKVTTSGLNSTGIKSCGCIFGDNTTSAFNLILFDYKGSAKKRNLPFLLSTKEFKDIIDKNCHYCGTKPSQIQLTKNKKSKYLYNGIDRIDNNKGYTIENCVPCCWICNRAKLNMTYNEFIAWINQLVIYRAKNE